MNKFTGHTPGPWYVSKHDDYTQVWKDYGDERALIAEVDDGWTEARINARLIAAAPDLLTERDKLREVLKEAVFWIEDDRFDDEYITEEWYHMALKVLTKETEE